MDKDWDLASYRSTDDYLSPPREDSAEIRLWGGGKIKVQARVSQALGAMLEARAYPLCRSKTALTRLAMRNLIDDWAKTAQDPLDALEAANLVALLDAEDLPELIKVDRGLVEKMQRFTSDCQSAFEQQLFLQWGRQAVATVKDPRYKAMFQREIIRLENHSFDS